MKITICFIISLLTIIIGCRSTSVEPEMSKSQFMIGGKNYIATEVTSVSESCNALFLSNVNLKQDVFPFLFEMKLLTNGEISYFRISDGENQYESSFFNPKKYIEIKLYKYDPDAKLLSFEFSGILLDRRAGKSLPITGSFKDLKIEATPCLFAENELQARLIDTINQSKSLYATRTVTETEEKLYRQYFYTNDGYRIVFEAVAGFRQFSKGVYPVSSSPKSLFRVIFQKYIGSSTMSSSNIFIQSEWQNFDVDGTIDITGQDISSNGFQFTSGKLILNAVDVTGQVKYKLNDGYFRFFNHL